MNDLEAIRLHHEGEHLVQPCKVTLLDGQESRCDVQTLSKALHYALRIIEAYALECRNLPRYLAEGNSPEGFCGGSVFTQAQDDILAASRR